MRWCCAALVVLAGLLAARTASPCTYESLGDPRERRVTFPRRPLVASVPVPSPPPILDPRCEQRLTGIVVMLGQTASIEDVVPDLQELADVGRTATAACRSAIEELLVLLARMQSFHRCTGQPQEIGEQLWTLAAEVATSKPRRDAALRNAASVARNRGWHTWTADGWHRAATAYRAAAANVAGGSSESELLHLAVDAERLAHTVASN